ncbi:MAG: hemolysin family protein [Bacteroidia bacterium]
MDYIPVIITTLLFTAFFAGIEIAFVSSNKFRIELDNAQGVFSARILSYFIKSPSRFIITSLLGVNVALVFYAMNMEELLDPYVHGWLPQRYRYEFTELAIKTILSTFVILIAGEFIPKVLFRINPNQTLNLFAFLIFAFYILVYPVVWLILKLAHLILHSIFKMDFVEDKPAFGRIDLDFYINEINTRQNSKSEINTEIQMFQNALDFDRLKVRECMIPRIEIVAVGIEEPVDELRKLFIQTGLSKILVYRNSIDYIIGFVHSLEMFKKPQNIQSVLLPIAVVPETMPAREMMTLLTQQRKSVAVVVDEHGNTSGMVTIEDIMEEIFGEIDDEHDTEELVEKKINNNEYLFSGRLEIDYINDNYNLEIPEGEYSTLAGFIIHHHESIPAKNEVVVIPPFSITIEEIKNNRIEQVNFKKVEDKE